MQRRFVGRRWAMLAVLLLLASADLARIAHASDGHDRVSFGQRIVVHQGETAGDVVCFLCSVENHGNIHGDVVSFLGGVKSEGPIRGDVVSFLGDVNLAGEAAITGDLVVFGGNLRKSATVPSSSDQVVFPVTFLLIPVLIFIAIAWGLTRLVRTRSYLPNRPFVR